MATLSELEQAFIAADDAGNTEDAAIFAKEIRRLRGEQSVKQRPQLTDLQIAEQTKRAAISSTRAEHPYLSTAADLAGGFTGLLRGAMGNIADFGEKYRSTLGMQPIIKPTQVEDVIPTRGVEKGSGAYLLGSLADPAAWATGLGVGRFIPYAPVLGKGMLGGAKSMLQNIGGGAIASGLIGGASEDSDIGTGMLIGAGAGLVSPVIVGGVGKAIDRFTGKTPSVRAKKVLQDVIGNDEARIRSQWRMAPQNLTAAQAAYESGNINLAALGERAARYDAQFVDDLLKQQKSISKKGIEKIAGGATQEAASAAAKRTKEVLSEQTIPMLTTELEAANIAGRIAPGMQQRIAERQGIPVINQETGQPLLDQFGRVIYTGQKGAAQEAGRQYAEFNAQRQLALGKDISQRLMGEARKKPQDLGWAGNVKRQRNADIAADNYSTAYDYSIIAAQRGKESAFEQMKLDSLAAHGLNPINSDDLASSILREANKPAMAGNEHVERALKFIAKEIDKWKSKGGGVIDAYAIDAIRKNGVNASIEKFMGSSSDEAKKRAAAGIMQAIKPHFIDAITKAGGTGYKQYLSSYEEGIKVVQRMNLGADAMNLFDKNPKAFIDLVKGNSPETVKKIFSTEDSIVKAMADDYVPLFRAATAMERDAELSRRASAGINSLSQILDKDAAKLKLFPRLISWKLSMAKQAGDIVEEALNAKTMNKVYYAMRSGKNAEEIMNVIPAGEKMQFLNLLAPAVSTSAILGQQ